MRNPHGCGVTLAGIALKGPVRFVRTYVRTQGEEFGGELLAQPARLAPKLAGLRINAGAV